MRNFMLGLFLGAGILTAFHVYSSRKSIVLMDLMKQEIQIKNDLIDTQDFHSDVQQGYISKLEENRKLQTEIMNKQDLIISSREEQIMIMQEIIKKLEEK